MVLEVGRGADQGRRAAERASRPSLFREEGPSCFSKVLGALGSRARGDLGFLPPSPSGWLIGLSGRVLACVETEETAPANSARPLQRDTPRSDCKAWEEYIAEARPWGARPLSPGLGARGRGGEG